MKKVKKQEYALISQIVRDHRAISRYSLLVFLLNACSPSLSMFIMISALLYQLMPPPRQCSAVSGFFKFNK